ncbi:DUF3939 domain-containing protein [Paraliobacillus salinarum]|uniref:DUF3939 domain-containing protein n=1 Tax=Paraliobacillus salinarum TaxID=1158996 RepID=UPI0015F6F0FF|nr:DUF3939 domain-containing protein [Paraliobacillus salinarum]
MWNPFKKEKEQKIEKEQKEYPIIDISLEDLKRAIHEYGMQLPNEVPLSVIVTDDLTIDYNLLAPTIKGIPNKTYYMSKETYEIFEEEEKHLAVDFDNVQRAVDSYIQQTKELPVIHGDPYKRVSYHKLEKLNLLNYRPHQEFYITDEEYLITNKKP